MLKRYQTVISAITVGVSLLVSTYLLGGHVSHLAYQHEEIIRTQDKVIQQQNRLLDIYLKGCGK